MTTIKPVESRVRPIDALPDDSPNRRARGRLPDSLLTKAKARRSPTSVSPREFFGKYADPVFRIMHDSFPSGVRCTTLSEMMRSLDQGRTLAWLTPDEWQVCRQAPLVNLLREAKRENDCEGYKRLLYYFLGELDVKPPAGVLIPYRWKPGRPQHTQAIHEAWVAKDRPPLTWRTLDGLAKTVYPSDFARAASDAKIRKNLRDRVRAAIRRHEQVVAATKLERVS
jgi:hypothetical protein